MSLDPAPRLPALARALGVISRYLAVWVILGALAAYLLPGAFAWTEVRLAGQPLFQWMFAVTMFAVGTVIDTSSFVSLVRRPLPVALGVLTQFTVMPALAWLTATVGPFAAPVALGFIIVGCAPGAMTSNVLTYLARGDTAYSVTLTTIASILSVVVTPALVLLLAGERLGMTVDDFWRQLFTIAWTVATPLVLGIAVRRLTPRARRAYELVSPPVAALAIIVICCFVIQWTRENLAETTASIAVGVVAINALGFVAGNALGRLYRLDRPRRVTLTIEIGMQNAGMGVVLAATTFGDRRVAIPAALFTIWCIVTAAGLIAVLERRRARHAAGRMPSTTESA